MSNGTQTYALDMIIDGGLVRTMLPVTHTSEQEVQDWAKGCVQSMRESWSVDHIPRRVISFYTTADGLLQGPEMVYAVGGVTADVVTGWENFPL